MSKPASDLVADGIPEDLANELRASAEALVTKQREADLRAAAFQTWSVIARIIANELEEANDEFLTAAARAQLRFEHEAFEEGVGSIAEGIIILFKKEAPLIEARVTALPDKTLLLDISEVTGSQPFVLGLDECTRSLWREIVARMIRRSSLN